MGLQGVPQKNSPPQAQGILRSAGLKGMRFRSLTLWQTPGNALTDRLKIPAGGYGMILRGCFLSALLVSCLIGQEQDIKQLSDLTNSPKFSVSHGFYDSPFDCTVSWDSIGSMIRYTLDCSDPRTSSSAIEAASPVTIRIDPSSTTGRNLTPAVVLRAYALVNNTAVSNLRTNTYIFTTRVNLQGAPGGGYPPAGQVNGCTIDYEMDPEVVNDPQNQNRIVSGLLAIPSISISTDLKNLFDSVTGILVNPTQDGRDWERPASVELIDPQGGEEGFQINAGLRIRGGYIGRKYDWQPKKAFRLFFRKIYGKGKLTYPLFGKEGVSSFDCVDLRTSQNYSWSAFGSHIAIFIRDVFSRDCQRDLGQPYTRSRAYHLYLNGMYWGLYQTEERPEASFAESYFGGNKEDYDVLKVNIDNNHFIEATDGNLTAHSTLWNLCQKGFKDNSDFFFVLGRNADGSENILYPVLVNLENLIDYELIIFYTGNYDSPVGAWSGNALPNNFYAIYNRIGRNGFFYLLHDAESTLVDPAFMVAGGSPNFGIDRTGPFNCGDPQGFTSQWLHQKLTENIEYRLKFADRVYRHFFNRGALTPEASRLRLAARRDEIDDAVVPESARWGDAKIHPPRTRDGDWVPAVAWVMDTYFADRTEIVLSQLRDDDLYPSIDPPFFYSGKAEIQENILDINPGETIVLKNLNTDAAGSIIYTIDGSDPRAIGGSLSSSAQTGGDSTQIVVYSNMALKARIQDETTWSALHEIVLNTNQKLEGLRVTEVHYNPLEDGDISGNEFEFLEMKNVGVSTLPLSGAHFVQGIEYCFPNGFSVASKDFIVLDSNKGMFQKRYGFEPTGEYNRQLDNDGERLTLVDLSGDTLFTFRYDDKTPWPEEPDNTGQSLVVRDATGVGDPDLPEYWTVSTRIGGSPGTDESQSGANEEYDPLLRSFVLEQNYPNPFNPSTEIRIVIPCTSFISVKIFDILGREVETLARGRFVGGKHTFRWNSDTHPTGLYFCRFEFPDGRMTRKLMVYK
jgi:hypothetical protein